MKNKIDLSLPGRELHQRFNSFNYSNDGRKFKIFSSRWVLILNLVEIEMTILNFEALNFPPDHPARDMQDTFFLENDIFTSHSHNFSSN